MSADPSELSSPVPPEPMPELGPEHQQIADAICVWLRQGRPDAPVLRRCAEQAVADLRHSISLESMPEMATRLTLVRLAGLTGAKAEQYRAKLTPLLKLVPPTDADWNT